MSVNKVYTNIDKVLAETYQTFLPLSASLQSLLPILRTLREEILSSVSAVPKTVVKLWLNCCCWLFLNLILFFVRSIETHISHMTNL